MRARYGWSSERPGALVVACSDGRLQQAVDAFLASELGIHHYDRLYLPGGPGALASCGELLRADVARNDLGFLLEAHRVEQLVLLFHGAAEDGPKLAICADYQRRFFARAPREIAELQQRDAQLVVRRIVALNLRLRVHALRAEVMPDLTVQFSPLA